MSEQELRQLREMFPKATENETKEALTAFGLPDAVEALSQIYDEVEPDQEFVGRAILVDFHNTNLKRALEIVENAIEHSRKEKIKIIKIITGKGVHSKTIRKSTIKQQTIEYLEKHNIKYTIPKSNTGMIICEV